MARTYGLSLDEYAELAASQDGVCAISGAPPARRFLHVDHDHLCPGTAVHIRGLLTFSANVSISLLKDRPLYLLRAALYLVRSLNRYAESSSAAHPRYLSDSEHVEARQTLAELTRALAKLEQLTRGVAA
ncbi:MAG: hypothetical protein H0U66_06635 [Gemmatimonadaceae bacterium]|nr:hypothetical protein [Gemmatimonadaceae bacterium]